MDSPELKPVVTLAALYGAGGSVVGPRVAERLGVPFLDRAIPEAVAKRAGLSTERRRRGRRGAAQPRRAADRRWAVPPRPAGPRRPPRRTWSSTSGACGADVEEFLARARESGGVALGRGGMVVLRDVPGALHVYLGGHREARVRAGDGDRGRRPGDRRASPGGRTTERGVEYVTPRLRSRRRRIPASTTSCSTRPLWASTSASS